MKKTSPVILWHYYSPEGMQRRMTVSMGVLRIRDKLILKRIHKARCCTNRDSRPQHYREDHWRNFRTQLWNIRYAKYEL